MTALRKTLGHNFILTPPKQDTRPLHRRIFNAVREAQTNIPYYNQNDYEWFLDHVKFKKNKEVFWECFSHLPILTKEDVKEQNTAFLSDHVATSFDIMKNGQSPSLMQALWHIGIRRDFYTSLSTGGTSGKPAHRWLDYKDANIMAQSFLESFKRNGWQPGESLTVFYPSKSYFTDTYADYSTWLNHLFGVTVMPFKKLEKRDVLSLLNKLKETQSTLLVIFPCVLQRVAEIMFRENIPPFKDLKYINVSGEYFLDCSKTFIEEMFPGAEIQSTYGAVEFGEIAHQKEGGSSFDYDVFGKYAYLENGPDDTILVTTLRQNAFPLIRYQIEDKGEVVTHDDGTQSLINLEGKNTDYLISDKEKIYASYFNNLINEVNVDYEGKIIHAMLRHEDASMQLNIILKDLNDEAAKTKIRTACLDALTQKFPDFETIAIEFPDHFEHDYTRKFKIIGEGDGLAEYVGGYIKRSA